MNRANLVQFARVSISRGSRSFALASRLFDRETRERAWLLYAWCRACDDIADGQDHGHASDAAPATEKAVAAMQMLTRRAIGGERTGRPAFDALGMVAAECHLPAPVAQDVIAGFALDAAGWRPETEDDLLRYCYHVAGAVGVLMGIVMGVPHGDEETLDRACDLGIAFQLANIARDVAEDAAAGRCYLPAEWLAEAGVDADAVADPGNRTPVTPLIERLCALSETYRASARVGAARLPFRARWAVLAAAGIYGHIARDVMASGGASLDRRIVVGRATKLRWVGRAFGQAMRRPPPVSRDGLWTRVR